MLVYGKPLQDESDRGLVSCIRKFFISFDNIRRVASLARNSSMTSTWWVFFDLLSRYSQIELYNKLSMSILLTIFDVSINKKRVYGSLCFDLYPQQMSQSKKKHIDLCQHANKYKQVVLETLS